MAHKRINLWELSKLLSFHGMFQFILSLDQPLSHHFKQMRGLRKPRPQPLVTTLIIPFSACNIDFWNSHYFAKSQNQWGLIILLSDTKFMNTCSFTTPFEKVNVCPKVLVECVICSSEFKEASSSSLRLVPLAHEVSPNNKQLKEICIKNFQHFDTLDSQNPKIYIGINLIM